jgi:hypothetical protein
MEVYVIKKDNKYLSNYGMKSFSFINSEEMAYTFDDKKDAERFVGLYGGDIVKLDRKYEQGGKIMSKENNTFVNALNGEIKYIISEKSLSKKKTLIKKLIDSIDSWAISENLISKRAIVKDNLNYAYTLKSAPQINKALEGSLNLFKEDVVYEKGGKVSSEISTLKEKIAKAKANKSLDEKMRKKLLDKYESELAKLEKEDEPKAEAKLIGEAVIIEKLILSAIKNKKVKELYDEWEDDNYHTENVFLMAHAVGSKEDISDMAFIVGSLKTGEGISDENQDKKEAIRKKLRTKFYDYLKEPKAKTEKSEPKKYEPTEEECREIIATNEAKRRKAKASAKKSAQKAPVTKDKEKIEKVEKSVMERIKEGKATKAEIQKLIKEAQDLLNFLKKALSKLK